MLWLLVTGSVLTPWGSELQCPQPFKCSQNISKSNFSLNADLLIDFSKSLQLSRTLLPPADVVPQDLPLRNILRVKQQLQLKEWSVQMTVVTIHGGHKWNDGQTNSMLTWCPLLQIISRIWTSFCSTTALQFSCVSCVSEWVFSASMLARGRKHWLGKSVSITHTNSDLLLHLTVLWAQSPVTQSTQ